MATCVLIHLKIKSWDKFNPRSDRGNFAWFRFQNGFFLDQAIFGLSGNAKLLFIFLCCEASRNNSNELVFNLDYVSSLMKLSVKEISNNLNELHAGFLVELLKDSSTVVEPPSRVSDESTLVANRTEQNRTEQNKYMPISDENRRVLDFDQIYQRYPRKEGKSQGLKIFKAQIKTEKDFDLLGEAIDRYANHCKITLSDPKFIKHFSTFMGSWRDWLDPNIGKVSMAAVPKPDPYAGLSPSQRAEEEEFDRKLKQIRKEQGLS